MSSDLIYPDEVDTRMNWPPGRSQRLAKRGKIPHYVLPDGEIRFRWQEIEDLILHIKPSPKKNEPVESGVTRG